ITINPQYMDVVYRNPQNFPELGALLFPGRKPAIQGQGGGSVRYNAATALVVNRKKLKDWLTTSITDLVQANDGEVKLSVAIIISAVGATGSGCLERLINLVVDCAQEASLPGPLHCDVFILEPGMQGVTELGLSNTLSLYSERAASFMEQNSTR